MNGFRHCFQVNQRFSKFLKVLFKQMLEEHGWSTPAEAAHAASEAEGCANNSACAVPDVTLTGSADDGLQGVAVHALVVSHGTYIHIAIKHLVEDLNCSLPAEAMMSRLFSPCPNTGVSRFVFTLSKSELGPVLSETHCIFANRKDHLEELE